MSNYAKIINGTKYDTSRADVIFVAESPKNCNDFSYWREALYLTRRSRRFFVHGHGGPYTRWSRHGGWGSDILLLSRDDAREWLELHADAETYESIFTPECA